MTDIAVACIVMRSECLNKTGKAVRASLARVQHRLYQSIVLLRWVSTALWGDTSSQLSHVGSIAHHDDGSVEGLVGLAKQFHSI